MQAVPVKLLIFQGDFRFIVHRQYIVYTGDVQFIELTVGQRFGKWVVLSRGENTKHGRTRYWCRCACGKEALVASLHLRRGSSTSCGCSRSNVGTKQWGGVGKLSLTYWREIERGANGSKGRRELEFSISMDEAWALFEAQRGRCALSGEPIGFAHGKRQTASLDRIDNTRGYTSDNVQWVHKHVNRMKGTLNQERFLELCKCIARRAIGASAPAV